MGTLRKLEQTPPKTGILVRKDTGEEIAYNPDSERSRPEPSVRQAVEARERYNQYRHGIQAMEEAPMPVRAMQTGNLAAYSRDEIPERVLEFQNNRERALRSALADTDAGKEALRAQRAQVTQEIARAAAEDPWDREGRRRRTAEVQNLDRQMDEADQERKRLLEELDALHGNRYAFLPQAADFSGYAAAGAQMEQNAITSPRENWRAAALGEMHGATEGRSVYHWMTDVEADTYNYLLAKEGERPAQAYLDYLEDELNRRRGVEQAEAVRGIDGPIRRTLMTGAYSVTAGLEQGLGGIAQGLTREQLPLPASQYGSAAIREDLADSSVGRAAYDLTTTAANMLPMMGVSALTAGLGAPAAAAQIAGNATMALSVGGNAYRDALAEGYTEEQARDYSIVSGLSEAGLQYLLGGVSALGGRVTGNIAQRAVENIRHAAGRAAACVRAPSGTRRACRT